MGIFGVFKKKPCKNTSNTQIDLDHLDEDGELPWGWYCANKEFTERIENEYRFFLDAWAERKQKPPKEEYSALKSFVLYMKDVKELCHAKGECFDFWRKIQFKDDFLEEQEAALQCFEEHFNEIEAEYKKKLSIRNTILEIVKITPGILQTEVYKRFNQSDKDIVSSLLYRMEGEGIIEREKSGRTYAIRMKENGNNDN